MIEIIKAAIERLSEQPEDADEDRANSVLRAREVGLASRDRVRHRGSIRNGHYSTAVEPAVKALNGLVRLRSGLEMGGMPLRERAFAPGNPIISLNDLSDQSDKDEQKGLMMMFCGAVAGLRNHVPTDLFRMIRSGHWNSSRM